ncbi:MAG: hypothetical protein ISR58_12480 [Anaerolineales bacterium]|nr:hypothetical protein [Chloroflexota bacterium]MBL6981995.1 hypothetical protein [Anaerolineales bacterium]
MTLHSGYYSLRINLLTNALPNPACRRRGKQQTTPKRDATYKKTKISHPYHPRCGEVVEIIRKCRGNNILVQTSGGERVVVATDWTEIYTERKCEASTPAHLLDYRGLRQACELIERAHPGETVRYAEPKKQTMMDPINPKSKHLRRSSREYNPKSRAGESEPGLGTVEPRGSSRSDPFDGAVGAQVDRGTDRKQPEGGL